MLHWVTHPKLRKEMKTEMRKLISILITLACLIGLVVGIILMITELPEDSDIITILKVNGGGVITFSTSLLLLAHLNRDNGSEIEKGGKYYGL